MSVKKQILRLYIIFSRFERQEISERYQNTWNLELDELNIALSSYITFWVEIKFLNSSVSNFKFFFATQSCSRQWNNFLNYQAFVRYGQKSNEWVDFVEVVRYYIVSIEGGMGGGGGDKKAVKNSQPWKLHSNGQIQILHVATQNYSVM